MNITRIWQALSLMAAMVVSGTNVYAAPSVSQSPAEEIAELDKLLTQIDRALDAKDSLEPFLYATSALNSKIDVFEIRFGVPLQTQPQWEALRGKAEKVLKRVDGRHRNDIYFNADSAETGTCVLIELAGNPTTALKRLDQIKPGGGCGNWAASVMLAVNTQKAGIYQRKGDYKQAYASMKAARDDMVFALGAPASDLFCCRYAFLAGKNGEVEEAKKFYQRVVDLYPKTDGDQIARKALTAMGSLTEPDLQRIRRVYLEEKEIRDYDAAIFAIAGHKFPGAYDFLVEQLASAENFERNRLIPALGVLGDRRALPVLKKITQESKDNANTVHALVALARLGDREEVVPCLKRQLDAKSDIFFNGYWLDASLREIYGDGPERLEMGATLEMTPAKLAQRWLTWIESRKVPAVEQKSA
ncbi:MAG: hypothetical protein JSS11_13070 [Verrucomicrobia bacterium]|nr:hypothetical protein [Verrucomicrobiota bacterium]